MGEPPQNLSESQFENVLNFRDIGAYINNYTGANKLKTGLFYRSARLDNATPSDRALLTQHHKITTIIDLRTKSEHIQAAQRHSSKTIPSAAPISPDNDTAATPLKIPGLEYAEINFNGSAYSWALLKQLRYVSLAKLLGLMAIGQRIPAIYILGSEVMASRGLVGLAEDSLTYCTGEVQMVFEVLAKEGRWPVLVHCTQGKDRTGLIVLLVLMLLGVERAAIESDYGVSQGELEREREGRLVEIRAIGLPDTYADCPGDWIEKVSGFVDEKYGGIEKYLLKCGVTKAMQQKVKDVLLA